MRRRHRQPFQCLFCTQHTVQFTVSTLVLTPYTRSDSVCCHVRSAFRDNITATLHVCTLRFRQYGGYKDPLQYDTQSNT
jgi:hypothetical protein